MNYALLPSIGRGRWFVLASVVALSFDRTFGFELMPP
jgi:hypothetical protein